MELEQNIRIGDTGGRGYGEVEKCSFNIDKTFSGYRLTFDFRISAFETETEQPVILEDLKVELFFRHSNNRIFLGYLQTEIGYQFREFTKNKEFGLRKDFYISANDFIRLIDQTYNGDVSFEFEVLPVLNKSTPRQPERARGWLKIPQAEWLKKINTLDLDRFELITIKIPVASSHLHKPFADALSKIREAEKLYERGELLGAAVACRSAWETVLSSVPPGTPKLEHMLNSVSSDPLRQEFALAVLKGFKDVINKAIHLEGDAKAGTPPADLRPEDVLLSQNASKSYAISLQEFITLSFLYQKRTIERILFAFRFQISALSVQSGLVCIHWYSVAIGYLSQIIKFKN